MKNFNSELHSDAYAESINRVAGFNEHEYFKTSPDVLKRRSQFWEGFFDKFSENVREFDLLVRTLKPVINVRSPKLVINDPPSKSSSCIQHWVDTGTIPFNKSTIQRRYSKRGARLRSRDSMTSSSNDSTQEKSNGYCASQSSDESFSSTSVDTTTYILSNKNITSRIKTMAIVEGAKDTITTNVQNTICESESLIKITQNENVGKNDENVVKDNDGVNCKEHSFEPSGMTENVNYKKSTNLNEDIQMQVNSDTSVNKSVSFETFNTNEKLIHNHTPQHSDPLDENLKCIINETQNSNSCVDQSFMNRNSYDLGRRDSVKRNRTLENSAVKLSHRKKLFSDSDSPVDLVDMESSKKNKTFTPQMTLHPAFDSRSKLQKNKMYKKNRLKRVSMFEKDLMNSSQLYLYNNGKRKKTKTMQSKKNVKSKRGVSLLNTTEYRRKVRTKLNYVTPELKNSKPVCLTNLSELDNQKHTKPNKRVADHPNLQPVVYLKRLSESRIRKYKKANTVAKNLGNLKPVVLLKRLSQFEIQKYKRSNKMINLERFDPVVRCEQLSESDIQKCTAASHAKTYSNNLSQTVQLQNNGTNATQLSKPETSIQKNPLPDKKKILSAGDIESDGSALLLDECKINVSNNNVPLSNLSVLSTDNCQDTLVCNGHSLNAKEKLHKNRGELNKNVLHTKGKTAENEDCINTIKDTFIDVSEKQNDSNKCGIEENAINFDGQGSNSEKESEYSIKNIKLRSPNVFDTSNNDNKTVEVDENLLLKENSKKEVGNMSNTVTTLNKHTNGITSCVSLTKASMKTMDNEISDKSELIRNSAFDDTLRVNNNKRMKRSLHCLFSSDNDDDGFIKHMRLSDDMDEHSQTSPNGNISTIQDDANGIGDSIKTRHSDSILINTSMMTVVCTSDEEDTNARTQNYNLSRRSSSNYKSNKTRKRIKSRGKVFVKSLPKDKESLIKRLSFRTKTIESDSESLSYVSSNSLFDNRERFL